MADNITLPGTGGVVATDDIGGVQYQRVKTAWGVDGVGTDVTATTPLPISTNASIFRFSSGNSSSTQINSGAPFNGARETALDQPSISLLMTSDQPVTLTIKQYIDDTETFAVPPIVYIVAANQGLSASFPLNGNYVRVTATTTSVATTTTFNLNTAYGSLPSSDGTGRMPISKADCVQLLSQTLSAPGTSSMIDTIGYGAVVAQISGVWQGNGYFESSNTGIADWDTVLVFSRDSLSLQDIVTSGGLYTVRPSGRYLRFVTPSVTGSLVINAIGRAAEGIAASDLLSLAMDRANNTPLFTELNDATIAKLSPVQPMTDFRYQGVGIIPISTDLMVVDCLNFRGASVQCMSMGTTGAVSVQWSNDGVTYYTGQFNSGNNGGVNGSFTAAAIFTVMIVARYMRLRMTTATTAGLTSFAVSMSQQPIGAPVSTNVVGTVTANIGTGSLAAGTNAVGDVGQQYRANATGAASGTHIVSAATTNATVVKASAGRLLGWTLGNTSAVWQYVKFYNQTTSPTVGTGVVRTIAIPPGGAAQFHLEGGIAFSTGIALSITTGSPDADATATTVGAVVGDVFFA